MTDRSVKVHLKGDISDFNRAMLSGVASAKAFTKELDTSTDRTANLTQGLLAVGPALVPIAAAGVPAVAGLTNQLGFAVAGVGVAVLAFQGFGDALKATNEYAIDPTDANLKKMRESLAELGPAGREFVAFLQEIRPELQGLQDAAQEGLFPGAQAGIEDLMTRLPQVERIIGEIAKASGDLLAEGGENLTSDRWTEFFDFLETEAEPALISFGRSLGNLGEGFANLWMAFDPVSDDFSAGFLQMSRDFAQWTDGLDQTQGFEEFLAYIERTGPKVWDTLGSLANALLQVVEAAAPVGEAALPVIEAVADAVAAVADSDAGPVLIGAAAGISAISRAIALYNVANGSSFSKMLSGVGAAGKAARDLPAATSAWLSYDAAAARAGQTAEQFAASSGRMGNAVRGTAKLMAGGAGLAFAMSDLDEKMGVSNAVMGAMIGSVIPGWGTAIGGAAGLAMDFAAGNDAMADSVEGAMKAVKANTASLDEQAAAIAAARERVAEGPTGLAGLFGDSPLQDDVYGFALQQMEDGYTANVRAAQNLRFEEAGLAEAMEGSSQSTRDTVEATLELIDARNEAANQALAAANAEIGYEQAISSANDRIERRKELEAELDAAQDPEKREQIRQQLEDYSATLDKTTEAGQANREALYRIAGAWNNLDPATQSAAGAQERAREEFIKVAMQMGATREQAARLASKYMEIPSQVSTKITLSGITEAVDGAARVGLALSKLGDKTIHVRTVRSGDDAGNAARAPKADGGLLVGPGGPRDDLIPIDASNGEFIVNAAATKANLSLLHAINSQKYADGGLVSASRAQRFVDPGTAGVASMLSAGSGLTASDVLGIVQGALADITIVADVGVGRTGARDIVALGEAHGRRTR